MFRLLVQEELPRAEWLQDEQWQAICDAHQRLVSAVAVDDRPLVVGSAKELVECVARVTLGAHGRVSGDSETYDKVLSGAHKAIEHAAVQGLAANDPLRQIPGYARKMAGQLRELRNEFGTGHGRAVVHEITDEVIEASLHAAMLWVRWALARLQTVLRGAVEPLISDLQAGTTFYGGDLADRLEAANICGLDEPEQRRLGVAVGQRAARETHNVRIEGIGACAHAPERWPDAYREGVIQGLFINEDGQVHTYADASAECTAELLRQHAAPERVLAELRELLAEASWSVWFQYTYLKTLGSMKAATARVPSGIQLLWASLTAELESRAAHEAARP